MSQLTQVPEVGDFIIIMSKGKGIDFLYGDRSEILYVESDGWINCSAVDLGLDLHPFEFYIVKP